MSGNSTSNSFTKQRVLLASLLLLCIGLRIHRVVIEANYEPEAAFEYGQIARNLVAGNGYTLKLGWARESMPTVHMPPGITYLLAGLYLLDLPNPHLIFQLLQVAASAATLLCIWGLAGRAFSQSAAWIAAILYTIDLNLMFTTVWVNETALNIFFVYLGLWLIVKMDESPNYRTAAMVGICFSLGALIRPLVLLILALALLWFLYRRRHTLLIPVRHCAVTSIVVFAVLAPWTVRNYRVTGEFVPVCSNWAINFWLGYNPRAAGSQFDADGKPMRPTGELAEALLQANNEREMDRLLSDAGWEYVDAHPFEALKLRPYCFLYFWLDHNYFLDPMPFPVSWRILGANVLLVVLTGVAMLISWRTSGVARMLLVIIMTVSLFYAAFHADIGNRFRMQMEPIMLIFLGQLFVLAGRRLGLFRAPPSEETVVSG